MAESDLADRPAKLVERHPAAVGLAVFFAMLAYFWLAGTFDPSVWSPLWRSSLHVTGMAVFNSTIPAYLIASQGYAGRYANEMVARLVATGVVSAEFARSRIARLNRLPRRGIMAAAVAGLAMAVLNIPWAYLPEIPTSPTPAIDTSIIVGTTLLWSIVAQLAYRQLRGAAILSEMVREESRVDLFQLDRLSPFARVGTRNFLIVVGAMSLMPLQSLDAELRWYNYAFGFAVGIPVGTLLLFLPMRGARERIRGLKRTEMLRLDRAIEVADRSLEPGPLGHLENLLSQRERIVALRDWPLDLTAFRRVLLYVVIPPLAWVGAALVEMLLNAVLD